VGLLVLSALGTGGGTLKGDATSFELMTRLASNRETTVGFQTKRKSDARNAASAKKDSPPIARNNYLKQSEQGKPL